MSLHCFEILKRLLKVQHHTSSSRIYWAAASSFPAFTQVPENEKEHLLSFGKITTMEFNFPPFLLQEDKCQFKHEHSPSITDAGYYSACGSLSPSSSIDSGCFSPPAGCWIAGRLPEASGNTDIDSQPAKKPRTTLPAEGKRRSRSKNPGTKRQTASEREKLRMRDLTKALHHLRTFLPPAVAPAGQTLTKIEILRLTIGYISHLSAQLGQNEEISSHETTPQCYSSQDLSSERLQCSPLTENWCLDGSQEHIQESEQYCPTFSAFTDSTQQMETNFPSYVRDAQSFMLPCMMTHNATDYNHAFFQ